MSEDPSDPPGAPPDPAEPPPDLRTLVLLGRGPAPADRTAVAAFLAGATSVPPMLLYALLLGPGDVGLPFSLAFLSLVLGAGGLALGLASARRIRRSAGELGGLGYALAGMLLGPVMLLLGLARLLAS